MEKVIAQKCGCSQLRISCENTQNKHSEIGPVQEVAQVVNSICVYKLAQNMAYWQWHYTSVRLPQVAKLSAWQQCERSQMG